MMITFINITVKRNNLLNLIIGCLYVSFFELHVSVILMAIIMSVRAKEIVMQQRFFFFYICGTVHLNSYMRHI